MPGSVYVILHVWSMGGSFFLRPTRYLSVPKPRRGNSLSAPSFPTLKFGASTLSVTSPRLSLRERKRCVQVCEGFFFFLATLLLCAVTTSRIASARSDLGVASAHGLLLAYVHALGTMRLRSVMKLKGAGSVSSRVAASAALYVALAVCIHSRKSLR